MMIHIGFVLHTVIVVALVNIFFLSFPELFENFSGFFLVGVLSFAAGYYDVFHIIRFFEELDK